SWGGMINGLLTLRGAWDKLRSDPVLKFFAVAVTFYGMATFEGPLLSIKSVSALAHYTDWIIAHVHVGGLGWNGFMAAGMLYWVVPRLFGTELYSRKAANAHFYIAIFGILMYVVSMWVAGVTQYMMLREQTAEGGLAYPNFVETVVALFPLYWTRLLGGTLYLIGYLMLLWNLVMTARSGKAVDGQAEVLVVAHEPGPSAASLIFGRPVILAVVVSGLLAFLAFSDAAASIMFAALAVGVAFIGGLAIHLAGSSEKGTWHGLLEGRALPFTVLTVIAVLVGGVAEIIPLIVSTADAKAVAEGHEPYSPLELEGRDVYIAEGCYVCHSQMIRPFTWETARYGAVSVPKDSIYDHPFQWGSKRTGPDLAREGGMRSNDWHYIHMVDPRAMTPGSIMPPYAHLAEDRVDFDATEGKLRAMRSVGVPYDPARIQGAKAEALAQAKAIQADLASSQGKIEIGEDTKLVALIAYLQRLGQAESPSKPAGAKSVTVAVGGAAVPPRAGAAEEVR
ncbi:MAG: cytochrome-c oxidase, cbb3-type subunit II, partial [Myxococcales bacterium]|nr:cytochrome-c oxidase, cbb3-type subunit II [Myxococcales bacterium]